MADHDPFKNQLDSGKTFKSDLLSDRDKTEWPGCIDYVAGQIADGGYTIGIQSSNTTSLESGSDLERMARNHYLRGIAALTGDLSRQTVLPEDFPLGDLLVEFADLRSGLEDVDRRDVPAGEVLSRLTMRTVQRQANESEARLARQLRANAETPRELVTELTTAPELAPLVESALPDPDDPSTLTTELASLDLTTQLWDHQLESLALWLYHGANAYVDMATATGKTVLGLAAVAHTVESGSLHPIDQKRLEDIFDGQLPDIDRSRPNDVLIVTTDDLLGIQWARLFQDHCHTPPSFTTIEDDGIQLPWGSIDIRSASSLGDVDPGDYRLAIFDEVHNYSGRSGWGSHLVEFIESSCSVLALTGSVTDQLESFVEEANRPFPLVYRYTHELALRDGVIPDFEWTLGFTEIKQSDTLERFSETAHQFDRLVEYEAGTYRLNKEALADVAPDLAEEEIADIAGEYISGSALADGLRSLNDDNSAPTAELESFATGVSNRTINRLNLQTALDPVIEIAETALSEGRPVLVLTRSYGEANEIWKELYSNDDDRVVKQLEAGASAEKHDKTIRSFDESDTQRKALIGPGKRIGQGNDIHSVEVGINIARPGSGANTTLVQRLGRLLRDAGGKETVEFHHLIGVPPAEAVIDPDGESFVRTVAEFFGQVIEPNTDGILKPPEVAIAEQITGDIATHERRGAPHIRRDEQASVVESAYAAAIEEKQDDNPTVTTDWFSAAFGDDAQPTIDKAAGDGRVGRQDSSVPSQSTDSEATAEPDDSETSHGENRDRINLPEPDDPERDEAGDETHVKDRLSPLAEHYDAFRSLGIMHKALMKSSGSDIPTTDPAYRWISDIRAILTETGYGDQEIGYGKQLATRSSISMAEYRDEYGTGDRITEFSAAAVRQPSALVTALLDDSLSALSSWVVPVAPDSGVSLPVFVETESELDRARKLLDEFPAEPRIFVRESDDDTAEPQSDPDSTQPSASSSTETDRSSTPVSDVRGISDTVADVLRDAGYESVTDLRRATDEELAAIEGVSPHRVQLIRATVGSM